MPLLKLILKNPLIEDINRYEVKNESNTILSNNIQAMLLKVHKNMYGIDDKKYKVIKNPNSINTLDKIEKEISKYKYAEIISNPEIDTHIYITYKEPLNKTYDIPFLFYVSDYIDFLYCTYSYLII